jgi:hypothetical protein
MASGTPEVEFMTGSIATKILDRRCGARLFKGAVRTTGTTAVLLFLALSPTVARSQTADPPKQSGGAAGQQAQKPGSTADSPLQSDADAKSKRKKAAPAPGQAQTTDGQKTDDSTGKQTDRILWVVPNFTAVSANVRPPPLTAKGKYIIAMKDSVDYSSFVWAVVLAGQSMALKTYPELGNGPKGYARYYWRAFVDQASGAFFTEGLVPAVTHEDPRYYTLGHGNVFHRTGYALSRVVLTPKDSGRITFNISEVLGNGLEAGVANLYYPAEERGLSKTAEGWATGLESAALNNIVKEFWPDIRKKVLRRK